MNRVAHRLVGYDRHTECVADEYDVPDAVLPRAKELVRVADDDPDAVMCYPLDAARARDLAHILGATIDTEGRDYFLEGFVAAEPLIVYWKISPAGVMPTAKDPQLQFFDDPELGWRALTAHRESILSVAQSGKIFAGSEIDDEIERRDRSRQR
jgi:hypothetical protein